jgi:NAD(P)-dependent dehydrogenase (short-subunit alcohol dehydrogenase family)
MARVLITGSSKGIGYDAALHLGRSGHDVIATMRNPNNSDLAQAVQKENLPVEILQLDVDSDASVDKVFGELAPNIDVLVNNAGIFSINAVEDESMEQFQSVMNTNYFGAVRCCKAVIPYMREKGRGSIINVTSVAGRMAVAPTSAYSASKHALEAFTECLYQETAAHGVQVALVEPGIISTPMATSELPPFKADSLYPQGRRLHAIFKHQEQMDSAALVVSEKIRYIIDSGTDQLRHPVGPDALLWIGSRAAATDEHIRDVSALQSDADYITAQFRDMGMDLSSFLN